MNVCNIHFFISNSIKEKPNQNGFGSLFNLESYPIEKSGFAELFVYFFLRVKMVLIRVSATQNISATHHSMFH